MLKIQISIYYAGSALMRPYYILIGIGIFFHLDRNFISNLYCLKKWANASFDDFCEE
jgi:hypothetical protein